MTGLIVVLNEPEYFHLLKDERIVCQKAVSVRTAGKISSKRIWFWGVCVISTGSARYDIHSKGAKSTQPSDGVEKYCKQGAKS